MIKFCSLYSGSSGNCLFLSAGNTKILIDAGLSAKRIIAALASIGEKPSEISAILITHEHSDHIKGAGILSRKLNVPVYANYNTWEAMRQILGPVNDENVVCFKTESEFDIGAITVRAFQTPHDAAESVGFNFFAENRKVTVATDIGHMNLALLKNLEDSDLLLLESNHDVQMLRAGPYPWSLKKRIEGDHGHLSNEMAAKVIAYMAEKGANKFLLGHLSRENNFPELAYQTTYNALAEKRIVAGSDVMLEVATRDRVGSVILL